MEPAKWKPSTCPPPCVTDPEAETAGAAALTLKPVMWATGQESVTSHGTPDFSTPYALAATPTEHTR